MLLKQLYADLCEQLKYSGVSSYNLDARIIFEYILKMDAAEFYLRQDRKLTSSEIKRIKKLINRRSKNEPIAYIIGHKEFYDLDFYVNKNVLIPRPETEWLIEKSIKYLEESIKGNTKILDTKYQILDMGTGSGNIITSLAKSLSTNPYPLSFIFYASDISVKALEIAKENAKLHLADKINFIQSDLFDNINPELKFDLIIANLPYVPLVSIKYKVSSIKYDIDYEPEKAIFANDNGAAIIKEFLTQAKKRINKNGLILIELDPRNALDIKNFAQKNYPNSTLELIKDLAGFDRYLSISID